MLVSSVCGTTLLPWCLFPHRVAGTRCNIPQAGGPPGSQAGGVAQSSRQSPNEATRKDGGAFSGGSILQEDAMVELC